VSLRSLVAVVAVIIGLLGLSAPLASAARGSPGERGPQRTVSHPDRDGLPRVSRKEEVGGPCGCKCPAVGGGVHIGVVGENFTALAATVVVVCGTFVALDVDPGLPVPTAPPTVDPIVFFDTGGLEPPVAAAGPPTRGP
jgi:hypothetical protein